MMFLPTLKMKGKNSGLFLAAALAAATTVSLLPLQGCGKKEGSQNVYVGYKLRNFTPYPIWANWSLVDDDHRNAVLTGGEDSGSVMVPSMWNYTNASGSDKNAFVWVVWPAVENSNYTIKLAIGDDTPDSARVTMYLTAEQIAQTFATCDHYAESGEPAC